MTLTLYFNNQRLNPIIYVIQRKTFLKIFIKKNRAEKGRKTLRGILFINGAGPPTVFLQPYRHFH